MSALVLSKPLYALLLISSGWSLVTALSPDEPQTVLVASGQPAQPVTAVTPVLADTSSSVHWRRVLDEPVSQRALEPPGYFIAAPILLANDPPAAGGVNEPPLPPPPPPVAPPPPFTYLGRIIDDGKLVVLLGREGGGEAVRLGDIVDGAWQVRDADEGRVELVYLPLNEARQLAPN